MCAVLCCVVCMCVLEKKKRANKTNKQKQLTVVGAKREAGLRRTEKEKQTLEEGDQ